MNRVVIGLGSGRCGTASLASLLSKQDGACVTHENCPMPWEFEPLVWNWNMDKLMSGKKPYDTLVIGDVGYYWVNHVERLLGVFPDTRFVCLKRDRTETMDSYMVKSSGLNVHPTDDWFRMFPRYDLPKREAVGAMWDDYYKTAEAWQEKYPELFAIMDMNEALNTKNGMVGMMEHLGIENPVFQIGIRLNVGGKDGT